MKAGKLIGMIVLTVLLAGCRDRYPQESLKTELVLNFSTPVDAALETKTVEDGDSFHNLLVLLVRDNVILHKKTWSSDDYVADAVVRVPLVEVGAYEVYAYANYDETAWQQVTIGSTELVAETGSSFNPDRRLRGISATMPKPEEPAAGHPMLLTGHAQVTVGVANNVGTVKLLRPVARLNVYINNLTPYTVRLDRLVSNNFFANQAFLIGKEDEEGLPIIPGEASLEALPPYDEANPAEITVTEIRERVYSTLLYEMALPGGAPCRLYAKVSLEKGEAPYPVREMGSATEGIALKRIDSQTGQASLLTAIRRNQELNVEMNIYYKTVDSTVEFWIENTYWTREGHVSTYTYD